MFGGGLTGKEMEVEEREKGATEEIHGTVGSRLTLTMSQYSKKKARGEQSPIVSRDTS